ncbi:MAG: ABC transporter ATP-binding protein [Actinomycetota bacterium]|nr:ABC transporter ATP-binding protein [Actinomycetota bacterium]
MSTSSLAIATDGLTKRFGDRVAVNSVDLKVKAGTAFGLLGPNGAGKTTLIRMLVGLANPSEGSIVLLGHRIPDEKLEALSMVGAIVEEPRFYPFMNGRENLEIVASLRSRRAMLNIDSALERVGLSQRAWDKVGGYSLGMRQRLGIARCLLVDPQLMILDEPMNGLDPPGILEIRALIRSLVEDGKTVLLSSHLLDEVEKTCDEVAILSQGSVLASGSLESILVGSGGRVGVRTSFNQQAMEILRSHEYVASIENDGKVLRVTLRGTDADYDRQVGVLARDLIQNGLDVYEISQERVSLESRFFEVTSVGNEAAASV